MSDLSKTIDTVTTLVGLVTSLAGVALELYVQIKEQDSQAPELAELEASLAKLQALPRLEENP